MPSFGRCGKDGLPAPASTCSRKNRRRRMIRCGRCRTCWPRRTSAMSHGTITGPTMVRRSRISRRSSRARQFECFFKREAPTASGVPLVNGFVHRTVENMTDAKTGGNGYHHGKRCRQTFETTLWLVPFPPVDRGDKPGAHGRPDGDAVSSRVDGIDPADRTVDEYLFSRAEDPPLQNHS